MAFLDSRGRYGVVSRFNHWFGALLVIALLAIGLYFHEMPRGEEKLYWLKLHISIGTAAFLFLVFRVAWRAMVAGPEPIAQEQRLQRLTKIIHLILLVALVVLMVSGPLMVWTGGRSIDLFGLFQIPSLTGEMHDLHEMLEKVHMVVSRVMLFSLVIHVVATIKHIITHRHELMGRMIG